MSRIFASQTSSEGSLFALPFDTISPGWTKTESPMQMRTLSSILVSSTPFPGTVKVPREAEPGQLSRTQGRSQQDERRHFLYELKVPHSLTDGSFAIFCEGRSERQPSRSTDAVLADARASRRTEFDVEYLGACRGVKIGHPSSG